MIFPIHKDRDKWEAGILVVHFDVVFPAYKVENEVEARRDDTTESDGHDEEGNHHPDVL